MSRVQSEIIPGLQRPVLDAQHLFRQLLDAMSQPGTIFSTDIGKQHPEGLHPSSYVILLSMLDQDTPLKLTASVDNAAIRNSLRFHNYIPLVDDASAADFVVCNEVDRPDLETLNVGTEAWPDQSSTLIIQCESFHKGVICRATGPGIEKARKFRCSALNEALIHQREKLLQRFPLGIDLILTCGSESFCIPRSTILQVEQN